MYSAAAGFGALGAGSGGSAASVGGGAAAVMPAAGGATSSVVTHRTPSLEVLKLRADKMKFTLTGTDISVANALRRVMIAEVPTMAIDLVTIDENSSVLHDEMVASRLGLVPLRWKPEGTLPQDHFNFFLDCDCEEDEYGVCHKCSIMLTLDVANNEPPDGAVLSVTSKDLTVAAPFTELIEVAHFVTPAEDDLCAGDEGILLDKLGPGQRLTVVCIARLGVGKMHAKWNPAGTVAMRYEPDIRLNRDLLERVSVRDRKEFVRRCQPGVFIFDEASEQVVLGDVHKAGNLDEVRKIGLLIAKPYSSSDNIVSVGFVPERFTFIIEATGSLRPHQILFSALRVLVAKLEAIGTEVHNAALAVGGVGAMAMAAAGGAGR